MHGAGTYITFQLESRLGADICVSIPEALEELVQDISLIRRGSGGHGIATACACLAELVGVGGRGGEFKRNGEEGWRLAPLYATRTKRRVPARGLGD